MVRNTFLHIPIADDDCTPIRARSGSCPSSMSCRSALDSSRTASGSSAREAAVAAALKPHPLPTEKGMANTLSARSEGEASTSTAADCDGPADGCASESPESEASCPTSPESATSMSSWAATVTDSQKAAFAAIGCEGCGCTIPQICTHASSNRCTKAKCRYCHCHVRHRPAERTCTKASLQTYLQRLHDGELSGAQYWVMLVHLLEDVPGSGRVQNFPAWLLNSHSLQFVAQCLLLSFAQVSSVPAARATLLRITGWLLEYVYANALGETWISILEQLRLHLAIANVDGFDFGAKEWQEMCKLRDDIMSSSPCKHLSTAEWPKPSHGQRVQISVPSSPWLGVCHRLVRYFAWTWCLLRPATEFPRTSRFGKIADDTKTDTVQRRRQQTKLPCPWQQSRQ